MSPADAHYHGAGLYFPRVSGDEPGEWRAENLEVTFSPRERG